jgi:hypothetical protein
VLALLFEHPTQGERLTVGPAPYFRLAGKSLRAGPGDEEVGFYENGMWHLAGKAFLTATADSPAQVEFRHDGDPSSGTHGPFENLKLVDGAIRHGPKSGAVLAKFDEDSQTWYSYADRKDCPVAVLTEA